MREELQSNVKSMIWGVCPLADVLWTGWFERIVEKLRSVAAFVCSYLHTGSWCAILMPGVWVSLVTFNSSIISGLLHCSFAV